MQHSDNDKEVAPSQGLISAEDRDYVDTAKQPVTPGKYDSSRCTRQPWPQHSGALYHEPPNPERQTANKSYCGLSKRVFWITVLVIVVVICAAIGGGVGGALGSNKSSSDHTTTNSVKSQTPTSAAQNSHKTSSSSSTQNPNPTITGVTSGTTGMASFSCNNGITYTASNGDDFRAFCQQDLVNNKVVRIKTLYTFDTCIDACAADASCNAVTYNANLTSSVGSQGGNCFLKNKEGDTVVSLDYVGSAVREL